MKTTKRLLEAVQDMSAQYSFDLSLAKGKLDQNLKQSVQDFGVKSNAMVSELQADVSGYVQISELGSTARYLAD